MEDHKPSHCPAYFETLFEVQQDWDNVPPEFAIITAYATTGETWSDQENRAADDQLKQELLQACNWLRRITGRSPDGTHREPGWAADLPFNQACDLGLQFRQDAIYLVQQDQLFVAKCHPQLRQRVEVGPFSPRLMNG